MVPGRLVRDRSRVAGGAEVSAAFRHRPLNLTPLMRKVLFELGHGKKLPGYVNLALTLKGLRNRGLVLADGSLTAKGSEMAMRIITCRLLGKNEAILRCSPNDIR